ncbi:MAG: RidA family protein [Alphaproteobacteria bacterium]
MKRQLISTGSPFEETAGYSRAVVQGNWCFLAGTTGFDYTKMQLPEGLDAQVANIFATIDNTLSQAGFQRTDIVRAVYYVSERTYVSAVFDLVGAYFKDIRPAATMLICDLIDPAMKIEIEVTALKTDG